MLKKYVFFKKVWRIKKVDVYLHQITKVINAITQQNNKTMITKNNNLMNVYEIVDTCSGIVISEFISTEFAYNYKFGYWNYLQTRKNYICRGMGINPYKFEIR